MGKAIFKARHVGFPMHADLTRTIEAVTGTLSADAAKAGVRLRSVVASGLRASVDQVLLEQALYLTLLDTLKNSPKGGEVTLTADRETDDCTVRLSSARQTAWSGDSRRLMEDVVSRSGGDMRVRPSGVVVRLARN